MPSQDRVVTNRIAHERSLLAQELTIPCRSFRAGHNVHWIQALRSANDPEARAKTWSGTITELTPSGLAVVRADGSVHRFLHHHMERLAALCDGVGSQVTVNGRYSVLRVPSRDGSYCFSVLSTGRGRLDPCIK